MNSSQMKSAPWRRTLLSAGGLTVGIGAGLLLAGPAENLLGVMLVLPVVGIAAGAGLGGAQLLVGVQGQVRSVVWTAGAAIGLAAGLTVGTVLVEAVGFQSGRLLHDLSALLLVGGLSGAGVGLAKWFTLRLGADAPRPGRWVAWEAAGLAVGALMGGALANLALGTIRSLPAIAFIALAGGAAEGLAFDRSWRSSGSTAGSD